MSILIRQISFTLCNGYILFYFSELLFWSHVRPEDNLGNWLITWIAYSLLAYIFLSIISFFKVNNFWSLFLSGSIFGWLAEGVIVQTMYEDLPLSISFTGLAWHALISIIIGWYSIQKSLRIKATRSVLTLAIIIGICSGLWAISWWLEPNGERELIGAYAIYMLTTSTLLILAYLINHWASATTFTPNRWPVLLIISLLIFQFFFSTVPTAPWSLIIFPLFVGSALFALRKHQTKNESSLLSTEFSKPFSFKKTLYLYFIPLMSTLIYSIAVFSDAKVQMNWVLYLITTPLGFLLFGYSLYKTFFIKKTVQIL